MDDDPSNPARPAGTAALNHPFLRWEMADDPIQRHLVGLEPRHAWRLKGLGGTQDEIVVPGILLDDTGTNTPVEASLAPGTFFQMQALAAMAELRMLAARARPKPARTRPEANVWLVDARRTGRRVEIAAIVALDRVVLSKDGQWRTDSLPSADLVPGERG
jgi:hypothetical protein